MLQKRIVVTGCAGYIGSRLCRHLLDAGHIVTGIDNLMYDNGAAILPLISHHNFSFAKQDVCWQLKLLKTYISNSDIVIPLAAIVGAKPCEQDKRMATDTNRDTIIRIVQFCKMNNRQPRIIYPNTNSGYGAQTDSTVACTEETPMTPISWYGETKCAAESHILDNYPNSVVLRLATVFGTSPRMRFDLMVNDFIRELYYNRKLSVYEGHFARNFVHIDDVCRAFIHAIDIEPGVYNLGDDAANMSKMELAKLIGKYTGTENGISVGGGDDPDKRNYIVSSKKLYDTGFNCWTTINSGIQEVKKACELFSYKDTLRMGNY